MKQDKYFKYALFNEDFAAVRSYLDNGANVDERDKFGRTVLMYEAYGHNSSEPDMCALLLSYGANVNARDHFGKSALNNAVEHEHPKLIRLFLEHGAIVDNTDNDKIEMLMSKLKKEEPVERSINTGNERNTGETRYIQIN